MVKSISLKKRYILFEFHGPQMDEDALKRALYTEALKFFGELGLSYAALKLVSYDPEKKTGVIRCERSCLDKVLGFLALINELDSKPARLKTIKTSGTIKSLEEHFS